MLPVETDSLADLLIRDTELALAVATQHYRFSGFAYVFEVGQPRPCFYLAIDTGPNPCDASTGEWTYPAGGFVGSEMSEDWHRSYALLDAYMVADGEQESHLNEVHAFLRSVMKQIRLRWAPQLSQCAFTVNECDDSDAVIEATYTEINDASDGVLCLTAMLNHVTPANHLRIHGGCTPTTFARHPSRLLVGRRFLKHHAL